VLGRERPQIGARVDGAAAVRLGCHVDRRARDAGVIVAGLAAGNAEIGDAHDAVPIDEHVRRLEVAMHDARAVRRRETATRLEVDIDDLLPGARLALPDREVRPFDELHHDRRARAESDHLVDLHDVRVREARHRLGLADRAGVVAVAGRDDLDRDLAIELRIVRGDDDAHAAGTDEAHQPVAADLRVGPFRRRGRRHSLEQGFESGGHFRGRWIR